MQDLVTACTYLQQYDDKSKNHFKRGYYAFFMNRAPIQVKSKTRKST